MSASSQSKVLADMDSRAKTVTDWTKCLLCQERKNENLRSPSDGIRGYSTLSENIERFVRTGDLPISLDIHRLDDGGGMFDTFSRHNAKFHTTCYLKFNNTQVKRAEKKRRLVNECVECVSEQVPTKRLRVNDADNDTTCVICDRSDYSVHKVTTLEVDTKIRNYARLTNNVHLLNKLSIGDLVSQNARYHTACYVDLKRTATMAACKCEDEERPPSDLAYQELLKYMRDKMKENGWVFQLSELTSIYVEYLKKHGGSVESKVNCSNLKDSILISLPALKAYKHGHEVLLVNGNDVGYILKQAARSPGTDNAIEVAAQIVRSDILKTHNTFNGKFTKSSQSNAVPKSLLVLLSLIMKDKPELTPDTQNEQSILSISQLIVFNSYSRLRKEVTFQRHDMKRETPLPIYLGLLMYAKTRKKELIDTMYNFGLSVSYSRLLVISTGLANQACATYNTINAVCPSNLRRGVFTTAAVDNIDVNCSSTGAVGGSFHGTSISMFQQPDVETPGTPREFSSFTTTTGKLQELPESFSKVHVIEVNCNKVQRPCTSTSLSLREEVIHEEMSKEFSWLRHANGEVEKAIASNHKEPINQASWAAYHSSSCRDSQQPESIEPAVCSLLPLFKDNSKSISMIRHTMDVMNTSIRHLNPDQPPVIALDQPLYAIGKEIQWRWPETYGEDKYVLMMGGLHVEMASLKTAGDLLRNTGWVESLVQAGVSTDGIAESYLHASNVSRTRLAHQVTAVGLHQAMVHSHTASASTESLDDWSERRSKESPQFQFWHMVLRFQLLILIFVRSIREGNFQLYVEALGKLIPWFFAFDHYHYARWVTVHLSDMLNLQMVNNLVYREFCKGKFALKKTKRNFSRIAIDQAHEQNNCIIKADGGAVGITSNDNALTRWAVSGPETARLMTEFQTSAQVPVKQVDTTKHHEDNKSDQGTFVHNVTSLTGVLESNGNPFSGSTVTDLVNLVSKEVFDAPITASILNVEQLGTAQFMTFVEERITSQLKSIYDPIKRNNITLAPRKNKVATKTKSELSKVKKDCNLFPRLYISCQNRKGDIDDLFKFENQAFPPSISDGGDIRRGKKCELLPCLEKCGKTTDVPPSVDSVVFDGAVLVNMLKPTNGSTFGEYSNDIFLPYLEKYTAKLNTNRIDVIWDTYMDQSIKANERRDRGVGIRRNVTENGKIPKNWQNFLRNSDNKKDLFNLLANDTHKLGANTCVISTREQDVLCTQAKDISRLAPSDHEEADTRIMLHVADAAADGHRRIMIRTVDTDVVVLSVALASEIDVDELWIAFGTGKHLRYIPIHEISTTLGAEKCTALPLFHAFTGCDSVSAFHRRGKATAWDTWDKFPRVTTAFNEILASPSCIRDDTYETLERFVILMYDKNSEDTDINSFRKHMFTNRPQDLSNLPPTKASLHQHIRRATYQGGIVWGSATTALQHVPSPCDWGWVEVRGELKPLWSTVGDASKMCRDLIKCHCRKKCTSSCQCKAAMLNCSPLCSCKGMCYL